MREKGEKREEERRKGEKREEARRKEKKREEGGITKLVCELITHPFT